MMVLLPDSWEQIRKAETHDSNQAGVALLLERVMSCEERGWYAAFLHALREAEYTMLHEMLNSGEDIQDQTIFRRLIFLFLPKLVNAFRPMTVMPHLRAKGCLRYAVKAIFQVETHLPIAWR